MGGSANAGKSQTQSSANEDVWSPQGDALQNLYNSANQLFNNSGATMGKMEGVADNLLPYNTSLMDTAKTGVESMVGGGSVGNTDEIRQQLMDSYRNTMGGSNVGEMYKTIVGGEGNTYIDPMVAAMKKGSMENLDMMKANSAMDAAAAGQGGSSRHAMENAMLGKEANRDMLDMETAMRGGAYDTDLNNKMEIARAADTGIQNSQAGLMQMLSMADANVNSGINAGTTAQNLGMGSMAPYLQNYMSPWNAMGSYANTVGGPTVLGSSNQSGTSYGAGAGASAW